MEMNVIILVTIGQLFLALVRGNDVLVEDKRVVGYYFGATGERYSTLYPEDIDASILTHLVYLHGDIDIETDEIFIRPLTISNITSYGEGFVERLPKLKEVNPKLKLILFVAFRHLYPVLKVPSRRSNIINKAIEWMNSTRFDGLQFTESLYSNNTEEFADFFCEMHSEFAKHGFTVSTMLPGIGPPTSKDSFIKKVGRCSDYIILGMNDAMMETTRLISPMNWTISELNWFLERGLPANKIVITIPGFAMIVTLKDANETGLGATISGPGNEDKSLSNGYAILYNKLVKKLNNSTEKWTICREEESNSPYAYTKTGIWASYEDETSVATKARYVLQRNLGGAHMFTLEMDDFDGLEGEERFPLTRAIHDTFKQGLQANNSSS